MSGATAGQAAYEARKESVWGSDWALCEPAYCDLSAVNRASWEDTAQRIGALECTPLAAQEPHAADVCPRSSTFTADGEPHTDTCDLPEGHAGNHHCPGCGASWTMLAEYLASRGQELSRRQEPQPVLHQLSGLVAGWRAAARELDQTCTGREAEVQAGTLRGVVGQVLTVIESATAQEPHAADEQVRLARETAADNIALREQVRLAYADRDRLRADLEAAVRIWREESEPYPEETAEDSARRSGFGYCADELEQTLAQHALPQPAPTGPSE